MAKPKGSLTEAVEPVRGHAPRPAFREHNDTTGLREVGKQHGGEGERGYVAVQVEGADLTGGG